MVEHNSNSTKKPCSSPNFDPSLTLALLGDRDRDHDHASGGGSSMASVCVKREREVKSDVEEEDVEEEEDDDNSVNGRKKLRLTKTQSALLEEAFKHHSSLNPKQKQELARELKLRPRQVEVWFQNRRARTKLKQTEVDCEYLKKCCEALKDENTRLHKELQELKSLKQSTQPPYMQLPAATLTMCPSCKRIGDATSSANTLPFSITPKSHFFNSFNNPSAAC
ncbi:hypothetical protein M8C21_002306 [Ambrosia artemisiifolia]|uniref:Homeobox domain-containing protein n=1 Tax=Ambrosia artemisiifolia TaxID=4212 RepID=A0AAD5GLK4_AMBAR|nr:hypothetical protein M8C21_002306 [Ambrosia artemisiifolia]